jgi:hypothetical protein
MSTEIKPNQTKIKQSRKDTVQYINLQLASLGQPIYHDDENAVEPFCNPKFQALTNGLIKSFREKSRLLSNHLSQADTRIQNFLNDYLKDVPFNKPYVLPNDTLILTQSGHARELSLPPNGTTFESDDITSYRIKQGILNNPTNDKRTTIGTFHIKKRYLKSLLLIF